MESINDYYEKYLKLDSKRNLKCEEALAAVKQDGYALRYVIEQTPEICLAAVKQKGYALMYVNEQTPEICLAAVKQDGYALRYVNEQTPEVCLAAVKKDGDALRYVSKNIFHKDKIKVVANGKEVFISLDSAQSLGLL
jgi:hypothetical protein